jgi:hypothetical protein
MLREEIKGNVVAGTTCCKRGAIHIVEKNNHESLVIVIQGAITIGFPRALS